MRIPWPLLVSLLGHGLALGALVHFAVRPDPYDGEGTGRTTVLVPVETVIEAAEPTPEPASRIQYTPPPTVPDVPPPERVQEPPTAAATLPPLPTAEGRERPWRVETIPLDVARRRVRPEPQPAPALRMPAPPPRAPAAPRRAEGRAPPRLDPIHTPRYWPRRAWEQGLRGHALVLITVGRTGSVIEATLLRSSGHDMLDQAALASARQWRFQPVPRPVRAKLPFSFEDPPGR